MKIGRLLPIVMVLGLAVALVGPAAALEETPTCSGETVSGTVVAVDEATGLVTVAVDGGGLCTLRLSGEYEHPIVSLLGTYFGDVTVESLAAALETTQTWVICGGGTCVLAAAGDEGAVAAVIVGITDNGDGTFTLRLLTGDSQTPVEVVIDDPEQAHVVMNALDTLIVDWNLQTGDDGSVHIIDVGDDIAAWHEDGLGFGVLVKLLSIAAESRRACQAGDTGGACDVTAQSLIDAFRSGTGLGELFQQYGRPSILGVGQVRNADSAANQSENAGQTGVCVARSHGGLAHANGLGQVTCTTTPGGGPEPVEGD